MLVTDFLTPFDSDSKEWSEVLPVLPLEGTALFPGEPLALTLDSNTRLAVDMALQSGGYLVAVQLLPESKNQAKFFSIGTVARVLSQDFSAGTLGDSGSPPISGQAGVVGIERTALTLVDPVAGLQIGRLTPFQAASNDLPETFQNHLVEEILSRLDFLRAHKNRDFIKFELENVIDDLDIDTATLEEICDSIAAALPFSGVEKQALLEERNLLTRAENLQFLLDTLILPEIGSLRKE